MTARIEEFPMPLAAFDIEIATEIPDGRTDWARVRPGISCAAVAREGEPTASAFFDPRERPDLYDRATLALTKEGASLIVDALQAAVRDGFTIVTWNGVGFDFRILAKESGRPAECAEIARAGVDMMFQIVCVKGHNLALDTALVGMGLEAKAARVAGESGRPIAISGKEAPRAWQAGEYRAVLAYCAADVQRTLSLALECQRKGALLWTSRQGRPNRLDIGPRWRTVRECLDLPRPDTSWMSDPPRREAYVDWMGA